MSFSSFFLHSQGRVFGGRTAGAHVHYTCGGGESQQKKGESIFPPGKDTKAFRFVVLLESKLNQIVFSKGN
jgi:hypothetical protein